MRVDIFLVVPRGALRTKDGGSMRRALTVRCSQLDALSDCYRRGAIGFMKKDIEDAGYELAEQGSTHIAAIIGTSTHSLMAELFKQKMSYGQMDVEEAYAAREKTFNEEIDKGSVGWDGITPHIDTARKQMIAICKAFMPIAELSTPVNVEDELTWNVNPLGGDAQAIQLIGHRDMRDIRDEIHDHKTGEEFPNCFAQLGGYSMLSIWNGQRVSAARVNFAPRLPLSKLHECEARSIRLDIDECMDAAWSSLRTLQQFYNDWLETKDPWRFPANPKSYLCSKKYCRAYNTNWCKIGAVE